MALGAAGAVVVLRSGVDRPDKPVLAAPAPPTSRPTPAVDADVEIVLSPEAVTPVGIKTAAVTTGAATTRNRGWILRPNVRRILAFMAIGVVITIVMEWLATKVLDRWTYAQGMPTIPGISVTLWRSGSCCRP